MGDEVKQKLNKETLEPVLAQVEYLKGIKKDLLLELYKALDGKVTQEDVEEFVKLFQTLDTEEKNEVPVMQLGTMMRMLQQIPTDNEVNQLADDINPEKKENISFYQFIKAMSLIMRDPEDIAEEVKKAFKVLDRHKQGYLMAADIREFLTKQGDFLTDEEVDEMIKLADQENNGHIQYEMFVDLMLNMKTEKKKKKKGKKGKKGKK